MSKILITGSSGVGKTTVIDELTQRGFTAIDSDKEPGLSRLEIKETGEPADWPEEFVDWGYYSWNLQESVLKKVLDRTETVFLGAFNGNQLDYYHLFDTIIVLTIDPKEHRRRMHSRPRRSANDDPKNIEERIKKYPVLLQHILDAGAIPVDSSGSTTHAVDEILKVTGYAN